VKSDSRLDPRVPLSPTTHSGSTQKSAATDSGAARTSAGPGAQAQPGPSGGVHISATARLLTAILSDSGTGSRPPSIHPHGALVSNASERLVPTQLASQLQQTVRESGLFYESHLAKWLQGKLSLAQLSREPQMQGRLSTLKQSPGPASAGNTAEAPATAQTASARHTHAAPNERASAQRAGLEYGATQSRETAPDISQSGQRDAANLNTNQGKDLGQELQALVRHQLELLTHPTLRWEGEITPGLWLQMAIQSPAEESHRQQGDENRAHDESLTWSSELNLTLPNLGDIKIKLSFQARRLALAFYAESDDVRARLRSALDDLTARVEGSGFKTTIEINPLEDHRHGG